MKRKLPFAALLLLLVAFTELKAQCWTYPSNNANINLTYFQLSGNVSFGGDINFNGSGTIPSSVNISFDNTLTFDGNINDDAPVNYTAPNQKVYSYGNNIINFIAFTGGDYLYVSGTLSINSISSDYSKANSTNFIYLADGANLTIGGTQIVPNNLYSIGNTGTQIYAFGCENPTPVTLESFSVKPAANGNQLSWQTGVESNNKGFEVQASTNGKDFSDIAFENAKGSNSSYQYSDTRKYSASTVYYRLNEVDLDGSSTYSSIVSVTDKSSNSIVTLYPNPATSQITVSGMEGKINVYDASGKLIISQTASAASSTVNIQSLPAGIYYLKDSNGNTAKFIKR